MPIIQRTNLNQNTILAVWKITESREELLAQMSNRITDTGKNRHDNIHWLASRVLLQGLYPNASIELNKNEFNKPALQINGKPFAVSITHSYAYAAVMISSDRPVALDLEKIDGRVERVVRKFVTPGEVFKGDPGQSIMYYTVVWSAKETLYKYYGKKELDFLENLFIQPFPIKAEGFMIEGSITKNMYQLNLPIEVKFIDGYVLTYSAAE